MEALSSGVKKIINFGTAGAISNVTGLVEVTGYVDRDMDVRALGFKLGQTPFEEGVMIGRRGLVVGSGDSFAIEKPEIKCDIVDMEAYAIARVCKKYDVELTDEGFECSCYGFGFHGYCKHSKAVLKKVEQTTFDNFVRIL